MKSLWPFYKKNGRKYKRHTYRRGKAAKRSYHRVRNALQNNEVTGPDSNPLPAPNNLNRATTAQRTPGGSPAKLMDDRVHECNVNSSWEQGVGRMYVLWWREPDCTTLLISLYKKKCQSSIVTVCVFSLSIIPCSYGNVMVVLSKKRSLDITIGDGLAHFTIRRSRNKRGQRFLGFYIRDQEIFSPQTHGMMGEWQGKSSVGWQGTWLK